MSRLIAAARIGAVVLASLVTVLLGAAPAYAHTRLLGSDPADGAALATAPQQISLTFNEELPAEFSTITVIGPDGTDWHTGPVTANGTTISTALRPLGPAGQYQIGYRVVSDDGHPVTGSVAFTLTAPGPGAAAPAAPQAPPLATPPAAAVQPAPDTDQTPVWPWIAGAAVLVGVGVIAALRVGRT
jgi:copper resistance protein C